jgi:serine/threonine-protein kinase HipA
MEDFCQLSSRLTKDKYKGSYEECGKLLVPAGVLFYYRELGYTFEKLFPPCTGCRHYQLTPTYELLPATLVLSDDKEETVLSLGVEHYKLNRLDFLKLTQHLNLSN